MEKKTTFETVQDIKAALEVINKQLDKLISAERKEQRDTIIPAIHKARETEELYDLDDAKEAEQHSAVNIATLEAARWQISAIGFTLSGVLDY